MKKIISSVVAMFVAVILFTGVYASGPAWLNPDNIPAGTYVIGTHAFDRNSSEVYNGTLTIKHIMLAAKTISGNTIEDMNVYYKRAIDGAWVDAIANEPVDAPVTDFSYYNGKEITVASNGIYDVLGLPDYHLKQVLATEQISDNQRKYILEVASVNCDEFEIYYKSAGEEQFTKLDNIPVVTDENDLSVIEVIVPGKPSSMGCEIGIRGINNSLNLSNQDIYYYDLENLYPIIDIQRDPIGPRFSVTLPGFTSSDTKLYVSKDLGNTYTFTDWNEYNVLQPEYSKDFDAIGNGYWFKATCTKTTDTGSYTSTSPVVQYQNDIKSFEINEDKGVKVNEGIAYRQITATITGDISEYDQCLVYAKPDGVTEYKLIKPTTYFQTNEDSVSITINIPSTLFGGNINLYDSMNIAIECINHTGTVLERASYFKYTEIGNYVPMPEMKIDAYNQLYITCETDTHKVYLEQSINGGEFVQVDPSLIYKTGFGGTLFQTVYGFLENVNGNFDKISFRAKNIKLDSKGNEVSSEYSKIVTYVANGDMSKEDITAIGLPDNDHAVVVNSKYPVEIEQKGGATNFFQLMDKTKYEENAYGEQGVTRCPTNMQTGKVYEYRARIVVEKGNETIYSDYTEPVKYLLGVPVLAVDSTYSALIETDGGTKRKIFVDVTDEFEDFIVQYKFEGDTEWISYPEYTYSNISDKTIELILPENYEKCYILVEGLVRDAEGYIIGHSNKVEVVDDIYEMTPNVVITLDEQQNYVVTATKTRDVRSMELGLSATEIRIEVSINGGEFVPVVLTDKSAMNSYSSSEPVWAKYVCERDGQNREYRAIVVHSSGVTSGYSKPIGSLG